MTVRLRLVAASALVLLAAACSKPAPPPAPAPAPEAAPQAAPAAEPTPAPPAQVEPAAAPAPAPAAKAETPAPAPPAGPALQLRAKGTTLGDADVVKALGKLGFELPAEPSSANLREALKKPVEHDVKTRTKGDDTVVVDATTGLMWQATGSYKYSSSGLVKAADVAGYVGDLNGKKVAGYSDWRLPTLEELSSVIDTAKRDQSWSLLPGFDLGAPWYVLTSDKVKGDDSVVWTIDVGAGDLQKYSSTDEYYVLLVRTMK
jgi:hypothetical protein